MIKKYALKFWDAMVQKTAECERHLTDLGYFIIITFPVYYLINRLILGLTGYESLLLRFSIGSLGLILVLRNYLPSKVKKIIPLVFYGSLFFGYSFFFFLMLLENPVSDIWKMNTLIGLFFLSFFLNWKEYIGFAVLGFLLAWGVFSWKTPHGHLPFHFASLAITYASPVVYLAVFSDKKDYINQEKFHTMKMLAGSIAHELRTPLSAMMMGSQALEKRLPPYQDAYAQAKAAGLPVQKVRPDEAQDLEELPKSLLTVSRNAHTMITMMLTNLNEGTADRKVESCSMKQCVEEALATYPLPPRERQLIHWDNHTDFSFLGHKEMTKHVLFNLLKNALYAIAAATKGEIFISLEPGQKVNRLIFKDTGPGISPQNLRHIFDRFYTKTEHGTGIGLAFCQSVIHGFGGEILCTSQPGQHTTFTITLPAQTGAS